MTHTCNNNRRSSKRETLENHTENTLKTLQHVSLKYFTGTILPCTDGWNYRDSVGRESSNREEGTNIIRNRGISGKQTVFADRVGSGRVQS